VKPGIQAAADQYKIHIPLIFVEKAPVKHDEWIDPMELPRAAEVVAHVDRE